MRKLDSTTTNVVLHYPSLEERVGDAQLAGELLELFKQLAPGMLAAIRDAVDCENAIEVRETAHRLKGAAAQISAARLVEALQQIEFNPVAVSTQMMGDADQAFNDVIDAILARQSD